MSGALSPERRKCETGRTAANNRRHSTWQICAALMCLHAARLPAKLDAGGDLSALGDQDRSRWDGVRVAQGLALLERSARGDEVTLYHVAGGARRSRAASSSVAFWRSEAPPRPSDSIDVRLHRLMGRALVYHGL
jgi:hypothetical protein